MTGAAFVKDVTLIAPERVYEQLTRPDLTHRFSKQTFIDTLKDLECHEEAAEIEEAVVPLPQFCFDESMILHLSPLTFKLHRLGGHTPACSVVYVPDEGVLFGSDVVITEPCPGLRDGSVGEWLARTADGLHDIVAVSTIFGLPGMPPCGDVVVLGDAAILSDECGALGHPGNRRLALNLFMECLGTVPVESETWGGIKAVYRH